MRKLRDILKDMKGLKDEAQIAKPPLQEVNCAVQDQNADNKGWVPIRRGVLKHIRKVNRIPGKNGKPDRYAVPTPWGLLMFLFQIVDFRTGVCHLTEQQIAECWGCDARSIRRVISPLFEQGHLIRLYPNRQDVFVTNYTRWDRRRKTLVRLQLPKMAKSDRPDKAVRTGMSGQVDAVVQAGGQGCPGDWTGMSGQVDKAVQADSGKSLEDKDSELPNKLIKNKMNKLIKDDSSPNSSLEPQKPESQGRKPGAWIITEKLDRLRHER